MALPLPQRWHGFTQEVAELPVPVRDESNKKMNQLNERLIRKTRLAMELPNRAHAGRNARGHSYGPPIRNWAFDPTFADPERTPPRTPLFQHIEATSFKQIL